MSLFDEIPVEIFASLLFEWIKTTEELCRLDLALGNRTLRLKYLHALSLIYQSSLQFNVLLTKDKLTICPKFLLWLQNRKLSIQNFKLLSIEDCDKDVCLESEVLTHFKENSGNLVCVDHPHHQLNPIDEGEVEAIPLELHEDYVLIADTSSATSTVVDWTGRSFHWWKRKAYGWFYTMCPAEPLLSELEGLRSKEIRKVAFGSASLQVIKFAASESIPHFFIRECYVNLLAQMCRIVAGNSNVDMILVKGNPGVGKSFFQVYVILCALRAGKNGFSPWPNTLPKPSIIFRQVGFEMTVIFIEDDRIDTFTVNLLAHGQQFYGYVSSIRSQLKLMKKGECLYLYDDAGVVDAEICGKVMYMNSVVTIVTISSNPKKHKGLTTQYCGNETVYFPAWTLQELQLIGKFMHTRSEMIIQQMKNNNPDDTAVAASLFQFDLKEIVHRFEQFGGIIRYAFPETMQMHQDHINLQTTAINNVDEDLLWCVENGHESYCSASDAFSQHLLLYEVDMNDIRKKTLSFPNSELIRQKIMEQIARKELLVDPEYFNWELLIDPPFCFAATAAAAAKKTG